MANVRSTPRRYDRHGDVACERPRVHVDSVHRGFTDEEADHGGACAATAAARDIACSTAAEVPQGARQ